MELELRRTTGSSAKGIKSSIGISYILEPYLVGLSCIISKDQFDILLFHTDVSMKCQYFILGITVILTLVGCVLMNPENNFILNTFYLSYTFLLVIIHFSRVRFIYSIIFGLIFLGLGYFLLELRTDNFANYFILHVGVLHCLILVFVKTRINSAFIITLHTICIGYSMTLIIIHSCSYYSKYNSGLVWFVLGLFTSWSLPQLLWSFRDNDLDHQVRVQNFSESLATWRFVFCFISFLMKLTMGKANFYFNPEGKEIYFSGIIENFNQGKKVFESFRDDLIKNSDSLFKYGKNFYMYTSVNLKNESHWYCYPLIIIFYLSRLYPFFSFMFSAGFILKSAALTHLIYCPYSTHQKLIIDNISRISYLIGCCFGAVYPASVTGNHYYFYIITFVIYISHSFLSVTLSYIGPFLSLYILYILASLSGFFLGYTFSYSLVAFTNSTLIQTCNREEFESPFTEQPKGKGIPCCGEKFINQCYCRYGLADTSKDSPPEPFLCSKFKKECKCLKYDQNGKCAIIICVDDAKITECCKNPCENGCCKDGCKCLGLLGIYKIDAVTTTTCSDCQLTVRIESKKCDICSNCTGSSGTKCCCSCNGEKSNCCCICVNCCDKDCCQASCGTGKCCCIKLCCCDKTKECKCSCDCKELNKCCCICKQIPSGCNCETPTLGVRVFICYKNCNNGNNCCLREIRPNTPDFDGYFNDDFCKSYIFDIKGMTLSDCCHSDMRIDLHCSLRNNYFRLNGVNYPNKNTEPKSLCLLSKLIVPCCKDAKKQCCCKFRELAKLYLSYEDSDQVKKHCQNNGGSGGACTCPNCLLTCKLDIDKSDSFVKRVNKFRVKLIVISFVIFFLVCFVVDLFAMILRYRNRPAIFNPNATYEQIAKLVEKKNFNSVEQVSARLTSLMNVNRIAEGADDEKINDLERMSEVLKKYMGEAEYSKLYSQLGKVSLSFLSRSNRPEFKSLDKQVILWSHCVGFFYAYAFPLFTFINEFFIKWGMMWNIEHENYIRLVGPRLNKMSHQSKYSLTLLDVLVASDKTVRSIGMNRTSSWVRVVEELKWAVKLDENEREVNNLPEPASIGEKLERFLRSWLHRITYVGSWITKKTNVFDWLQFNAQYEKIESWIEEVSPYLKLGSEYVNIPPYELNQ